MTLNLKFTYRFLFVKNVSDPKQHDILDSYFLRKILRALKFAHLTSSVFERVFGATFEDGSEAQLSANWNSRFQRKPLSISEHQESHNLTQKEGSGVFKGICSQVKGGKLREKKVSCQGSGRGVLCSQRANPQMDSSGKNIQKFT